MRKRRGKIVAGFAGVVVAVLIGVCWPQLVAWYKFHSLFESIGKNEQGFAEYRHRETGIVMVRVPGTAGGFSWRGGNNLAVEPFLMAKNQVKRSEWWRGLTADKPPLRGEDPQYIRLWPPPRHRSGSLLVPLPVDNPLLTTL